MNRYDEQPLEAPLVLRLVERVRRLRAAAIGLLSGWLLSGGSRRGSPHPGSSHRGVLIHRHEQRVGVLIARLIL